MTISDFIFPSLHPVTKDDISPNSEHLVLAQSLGDALNLLLDIICNKANSKDHGQNFYYVVGEDNFLIFAEKNLAKKKLLNNEGKYVIAIELGGYTEYRVEVYRGVTYTSDINTATTYFHGQLPVIGGNEYLVPVTHEEGHWQPKVKVAIS
ncbi:hypothetical protein [Paenibacillus terrae]|uniref:Uncharacterized protein n=1 Tax=Paenibacillus terrae TaxID=159743 RepID=A0A0D7WXQ1_9BACL|nr:hypothetical protein [Paenibacillus terrae]KJD43971.1 hypothetical protein QD47_19350 [Paenibacillus terrae]